MLVWLPLVGAVTGALAGTAGWAVDLVAPHALAVAMAFGLSIVLTGALHVDGFLDSCDALFASVSPERRRAILKDPHHGTFAIAFFAVLCAVWLAALWSIDPVRLPLALAFAGAAARWIAAGIALRGPLGASAGRTEFATHLALGALVVVLGWSYWGHAAVLIALGFVTVAVARWMRRRLDGPLTGDGYGFLIAGTEVGILALLPLTSP